jgi:prepilin-type N-terminal cleavage/methylation domain-containing protein
MKMNNKKGFTLIEMLVVIAIIGLLSSVVIIGLSSARAKARDARRITDVAQLANWAEVNYKSAGGYQGPELVTGGLPIKTDPQGKDYIFEPASGQSQTAKIGICLETKERDTTNANCPAALGACTSGFYFCSQLSGL